MNFLFYYHVKCIESNEEKKMNAVITENDIVNYYEQCQVDYEIVWHLNSQMCMHYGYWDEATPTLRSALRNMNAKLAEFAEIKTGEKILDAGCGVGGSSIFLARNFGCEVEGITLSKQQANYATQKTALHKGAFLLSWFAYL